MKEDAALLASPAQQRMPRRHDVDFMAKRGDLGRDRLHERPDAVARKPRVRRRHHHDDVPCVHVVVGSGTRRPELNRSRHGMMSDSISTDDDTFDCPTRRSTKMIGTSARRKLRRLAS